MTVQAFMTSGILEKYALGMASDEEKNEVLEMASQHLEIKEELSAIRKTLKGYVLSHQVTPPGNLKDKVMTIGDRKSISPSRKETSVPSSSSYQDTSLRKKEKQGANVATIAAALLGLGLLAACFMAYSFFEDALKAKADLEAASLEIENVKKQVVTEQEASKDILAQLSFYQDRDNEVIILKGTNRSPRTNATIYWNEVAKTASIDLPTLPSLANNKVAVLWGSTNRQPLKVGILKVNEPGERTSLTYIENAELFFVTEEDNASVTIPNRSRILMAER